MHIETDPQILASFLGDAAHVPGGFSAGVAFPRTIVDVAAVVSSASAVLPVGAQSSLTGGATPRGEVVLSTRALTGIDIDPATSTVRAGAGVPLSTLQKALAGHGLWYPPAPTYDGAFVGGTISTNAAGAATFKYGTTRDWVVALTLVLADGHVMSLRRGEITSGDAGFTLGIAGQTVNVPLPGYTMPTVPKLSAGYFARRGMDLVDLFVGSEGTLAVVVDATLRVVRRPAQCVALITCAGDQQALQVTGRLREQAQQAWRGEVALDVSAIEYMDERSLAFLPDAAFSRASVPRPPGKSAWLLVQMEICEQVEPSIDMLAQALSAAGITSDPIVALPGDEAAATRLFELREAVPTAVNAAVGSAKQSDAEIQKTAGDFIVPFGHLAESIELYRNVLESRGLEYALWGHVSDGNLHPNVIPRSRADMHLGREALAEAAHAVMAMGGAPLAEHGVGRSALKQHLLREMYGETGIEQMRAVKRALDPGWKLAPGVLFPA